jgi:hypothetical protein
MMRDLRIRVLAYTAVGVALFPLSEWLATQPFGTGVLLIGQFLFLIPAAVVILCSPVILLAMFFQVSRGMACRLLWYGLAGLVVALCGIYLGGLARMAGMRAFAQRSEPLIKAIKQFEADHGETPQGFDELVPKYLAARPRTGMAAYPEYRYHRQGDENDYFLRGNPWALSVFTPRGLLLNFDMMIYLPDQDYPKQAYGGMLERVGAWAYVHE